MTTESSPYGIVSGELVVVPVVQPGIHFLGPHAVTEMSFRLFSPAIPALAVGFLGPRLLLWNERLEAGRGQAVRSCAELLLSVGLLLFLFRYIFAAKANMDYVQRFIAGGEDLNLAIDTTTERTTVALRFGVVTRPQACALISRHYGIAPYPPIHEAAGWSSLCRSRSEVQWTRTDLLWKKEHSRPSYC